MKFEEYLNEDATIKSATSEFTPESGIGQFLLVKKGIGKAIIDFITHEESDVSFGKGDIYFAAGKVDPNNNLHVECKVVGEYEGEYRIFTFDVTVNGDSEVVDADHDEGDLSFDKAEDAHKKASTFGIKL